MAKAKSSTALVQKSSAALESWEQELASQAKDERSQETLGVPRISHQGGVLTMDEKPIDGGKLKLVIVDYIFEKSWYSKPWSPGVAATPECYAFARPEPGEKGGMTEARMTAHEQSPERQNLKPDGTSPCNGCKWNAFNTGKGKAKACGDRRRLLVLSPRLAPDGRPSVDPEVVDKAELRQLSIPPASLKKWGDYLGSLGEKTRTGNVRESIVEISVAPLGKGRSGHGLSFAFAGQVPQAALKSVFDLYKTKKDALMTPYPVLSEPEEPEEPVRSPKANKKLK